MASPEPSVALALITAQPTFDSNTISLYLQVVFSAGGYYQQGGINAGVKAFASALGVNVANFVFAEMINEAPYQSSPPVGGYLYQYNPGTDTIQILAPASGGTQGVMEELQGSYGISAAILNSSLVLKVTYARP